MNYIREELLRQQELLVVLLTGRRVHTSPEELQTPERETWMETVPATERGNRIFAGAEAADAVICPGETADLDAGAFFRTTEETNVSEMAVLRAGLKTLFTGQITLQEAALRAAAKRQIAVAGPQSAAAGMQSATTERQDIGTEQLGVADERQIAAGRRAEMKDGSFSEIGTTGEAALLMAAAGLPAETAETGAVRLVTELRQTGGGGSLDAAALSRTFQRDARRYDGGFRLY